MQYLTVYIVLRERKINVITVFIKILKVMAKLRSEREMRKVVSSNCQEIFNREKAVKNKNKNQTNASCFPFVGFFLQISNYQI